MKSRKRRFRLYQKLAQVNIWRLRDLVVGDSLLKMRTHELKELIDPYFNYDNLNSQYCLSRSNFFNENSYERFLQSAIWIQTNLIVNYPFVFSSWQILKQTILLKRKLKC